MALKQLISIEQIYFKMSLRLDWNEEEMLYFTQQEVHNGWVQGWLIR